MRFTRVRSLICIVALFAIAGSAGAQERGAVLRKRIDQRGDLIFAGNSLHTCVAGQIGCSFAQNSGGNQDDNEFIMDFIDADGDSSTFNSSGSTLALPQGATVSWARLYWFCPHHDIGTDPPDDTKKNVVKFKVPGGGYQTITADVLDDGLLSPQSGQPYGDPYLGQADVTSKVTQAGEYWVGNVQCSHTASNIWSGWTLVVMYELDSDPIRTIALYDAYTQYTFPNGDVTLTLNGFVTPGAGEVHTHIGVVLGDGDRAYDDSVSLNGTPISDANNPPDNIGNSSISRFGQLVTARTPNYVNTLGYDQDLIDSVGALPNGAMSATIKGHSTQEHVFVGLISFSTEIFAPALDTGSVGGMTVTDLTHPGEFRPGDILEYKVNVKNNGQDAAIDTKLTIPIPPNTTYVAGSISINGSAISDTSGNDTGEYDGTNKQVVARIGTGANATSGGTIAIGAESGPVTFQVQIANPLANGTVVNDQAKLDYAGQTLGAGIRYQGVSDGDGNPDNGNQPTTFTVQSAPDVHVTITDAIVDTNTNMQLDPGEEVDFTITVTNTGDDTAHGVVITNPFDPNLIITSVDTDGYPSTTNGNKLTVNVGDLPVGTVVTIVVKGTVKEPFPNNANGQVGDSAAVTGTNFGEVDGSKTVQVTTGCDCLIGGKCVGSGTVDSQNSCERCDPQSSTTDWSPVPGMPTCDDGKACTNDEHCDGAKNCVGTPGSACNDGLACTTEGCNQDGSCSNTIADNACVIGGECVASGTTQDGSPCHECLPATSQTGYSNAPPGQDCATGSACSINGQCNDSGACVGTPLVCDDGKSCTTDACDSQTGCFATVSTGCLIDGVCVESGAKNPKNDCEQCTPAKSTTEWSDVDDGITCAGGNLCMNNTCNGKGTCMSGAPKSCADNISCTIDSCNTANGNCEHAIPADTCVINDACVAAGTTSPTNTCRVCDPTKVDTDYSNAPQGTTCDDGLGCTTNDTCNSKGVCIGTAKCDDGFTCTLDTCGKDGCQHALAAGFCLIGNACVPGGNADPADACKACIPAQSTSDWSTIASCAGDAGTGGNTPDANTSNLPDANVGGEIPDAPGEVADATGSGGPPDAGGGPIIPDARGELPDAPNGTPPDARPDAREVPDAAAGGGADAKIALDARPAADARGGTPLEPDKGFVEGGGCACTVDGHHGAPPYSALLLIGLVALLKRRRRS